MGIATALILLEAGDSQPNFSGTAIIILAVVIPIFCWFFATKVLGDD